MNSSLNLLSPTSSASTEVEEQSPTAAHLERLSARIAECVSTQNWTDEVFEHFSEDFKAYVEHSETPIIRSPEEYFEVYKGIAAENPEYRSELLSVKANVKEREGTATVWLLLRIIGHPKNVVRESVTIAYFKRRKGKWWLVKQRGIRGIACHPWDLAENARSGTDEAESGTQSSLEEDLGG